MAPTEGNRKLLAVYDSVSQDFGFGPVTAINPRNAGAADISFVADKVDMAIDGIGLMGAGGHTVEETADLEHARFADHPRRSHDVSTQPTAQGRRSKIKTPPSGGVSIWRRGWDSNPRCAYTHV